MTSSVGHINFGVGIKADGVSADLLTAITTASSAVQRHLDANPLKFKIKIDDIDTAAIVKAAQTKLDKSPLDVKVSVESIDTAALLKTAQTNLDKKSLSVKVTGKFSTTGLIGEIRTALRDLAKNNDFKVAFGGEFKTAKLSTAIRNELKALSTAEEFKVTVKGAFSTTGLSTEIRTALANLPGDYAVKVAMKPDFSRFPGEVLRGLREIQRLFDFRMDIPIGLDSAAAIAQAMALRSRLSDIFGTPIDQRVNLDVDRGILGKISSLKSVIGSIGTGAAGIAAVSTAIAAITGAAGAALGAVGGLSVGLLALGPAAGAIGATVGVGVQGLGDAFSAMSNVTKNAGKEAASTASAVEAAMSGLESAQDAAADSADALADAQDDATKANEDVAASYAKAEKEARGYALTAKEAELDVADAVDRVTEARREAEAELDPAKRAAKFRDLERAQIAQTRAEERNAEAQAKQQDYEQNGVENSDTVVAAKERKAAADERVEQAAKAAARANEAVTKASEAVVAAQTKSTASATAYDEALAKLAPNAQLLVKAVEASKPAFEAMGDAVQNVLTANLGEQFSLTANTILPRLQEGMTGVAGELNGMAVGALEFLRSAQGMQLLNASFASGENLLRGLRSGTGEFTQGILDLTTNAAPAMYGIGQAIAGIGEGFGRALSQANASGDLTRLFDGFTVALQGLEPLIDGLVSGLITMGAEVLPSLGPLFSTLGGVIEKIAPSLGSIGATFLDSITEILPVLGDLISAFAEGLEPILPVVADLIKVVAAAITPLIPVFSEITTLIGDTLIDVIIALAPSLEPLVNTFGLLLEAVVPILPLLGDLITLVITSLAPALNEILSALGPVIEIFVAEMRPVLEDMAPILAEVATTIGKALADALRQIAPILPPLIQAWGDWMLAILPLIPELTKLIVDILPPMIDVIVELTPVIIKVIEAFTWLVKDVLIPLVIPVIQQTTESFKTGFETIGTVVSFVVDEVFPRIGTALGKVQDWFKSSVDWIRDKWGDLRDAVSTPINFVITTVLNNGLFKAWNAVGDLLGGALPHVDPLPEIPKRATGGRIGYTHGGSGNKTKDDLLYWGSNDEHVWTADETRKAGGHDIVMAIRDMISRGIPFSWDSAGAVVSELGRDNLARYGAAVSAKGIGNVPPEGLFDPLIPRRAQGGPLIFPWMRQLAAGHDFARAQNGKNYQWAGPRFVGDSFDCSGFMASIIASIQGANPWQRYWATSSFAGYPQVGAQGLVKNLTEGVGMLVGITDDPGGPGGGHTAGELRGIPELGIPSARVESGGSNGNVQYGRNSTPVGSFASLYGLPIGANGFFAPSTGGGGVGPSTDEQKSFITKQIERMITSITGPIREGIVSTVGVPPPQSRRIPPAMLDLTEREVISFLDGTVGNLGDLLGGVWAKAHDLGGRVLDLVNPFDSGGIARGTGFMAKNVIAPERVLDPSTTQLFEVLVSSLRQIATGTATVDTPVVEIASDSIAAIGRAVGLDIPDGTVKPIPGSIMETDAAAKAFTETGEILSDTQSTLERTETSLERTNEERHKQVMAVLSQVADKLAESVLIPTFSAAINEALKQAGANEAFTVLGQKVGQVAGDIISRTIQIAAASGAAANAFASGGVLPGYTPGRDVHMFSSPTGGRLALSGGEAIMVPEWTRSVGGPAAVAAMNRKAIAGFRAGGVPSFANGGTLDSLGGDLIGIGGPLGGVANVIVKAILQVAGIEIEIRDTLQGVAKEVREFRGDAVAAFNEQGEIASDTSSFIERTETDRATAESERDRVMREILKGVLKFLITTILIPVISAILSSLITLATTAIGTAIAGPVGTVIGAAVGAGLSGIATIIVASIGAVLAGGIDAVFDSGGLATGIGFMPKNILAPERVLDPRTTDRFDRFVSMLDRPSNRTVQIGSISVNGRDPAGATNNRLLSLLNT